jgi:uncharacterized coiled-coil protein SlyX
MAASAWQVTLFDLDKQLNRQRALMERMADDIKHLRKQFNQVQRDLAKFQKNGENKDDTIINGKKRKAKRLELFSVPFRRFFQILLPYSCTDNSSYDSQRGWDETSTNKEHHR